MKFLLIFASVLGFLQLFSDEFIGRGRLCRRRDVAILYLEGSPYERGYQHGALLKDQIVKNLSGFISTQEFYNDKVVKQLYSHIDQVKSHIPSYIFDELRGISDGANVPFEKILLMNLFPEMFHCVGITLKGSATHDGSLYHIRVLDYDVGNNLYQSAVLAVIKPDEKNSYLSVSYAGFIGTVTAMNEKKIAIGEITGKQYGPWNGMPMGFLLKEVIENSSSITEAMQIINNTPRTAEYYYVISDGKVDESLGVYCTHENLTTTRPAERHALSSCNNSPKCFHDDAAFLGNQANEFILLGEFESQKRVTILVDRLQKEWGDVDHILSQKIILPPVTNHRNLHNAIFHPSTLDVWISNMGMNRTPASLCEYIHFNLRELLKN